MEFNFIKNQQVKLDENKQHEFKEIKAGTHNPVDPIANTAPEYIVGFLNVFNGKGGAIYWGVTNQGIVSGVKLSREQRDDIGLKIDNKFNNIKPPVAPSMYEIKFHHVYDDSHEPIFELYVVEITLLYTENHLYFENGENCWIKTNSGKKKLAGLELVSELKKRYQVQDNIYLLKRINITEFFEIISDIRPIFYWLHSHVPAEDVNRYFENIQRIIFRHSYLFASGSGDLIGGTELILRILINFTKPQFNKNHDMGYIEENLLSAYPRLANYIKLTSNSEIPSINKNMIEKEIIGYFIILKEALKKCSDYVHIDERTFLHFTINIIHYFLSNIEHFEECKKECTEVPEFLADSFCVLLEPYFKSIGVDFIDKTSDYLNDLKVYCDFHNENE